jgi:hypothetical protein
MGDVARFENDNDQAAEPKVPTGPGWSEFFHELGMGMRSEEGSSGAGAGLIQERSLYISDNGDRWSLCRDVVSGRVFVRHCPNLPSGGRASDVDVGEFLVLGGMGPEKQELLRLIGTTVGHREVTD